MTGKTIRAKSLRLAPIAVLIYDCSRFLFLLMLLSIYQKPESPFNLPLVMFTAPNALFPLMSFFLLVHFESSKAYKPLYIMGKSLSLLCIILWLIFTMHLILNIQRVLWAVFLGIADLGTISGIAVWNEETNLVTAQGGE
ncbi:MAG: hypothetical protein LBH07_02610 [Treponema sp.]|jgi:hypothetical protein|nr:hypothetical protein [Treponema sp.]